MKELIYVCCEEEIWKDIPIFPGFQASTFGRIKTIDRIITFKNGIKRFTRGKILRQRKDRKGYPKVRITLASKSIRNLVQAVHKLIMLTFKGERPLGYQINHIDGIKTNNRPDNLEYVTASRNMKHAYELGLNVKRIGINAPSAKLKDEDIIDIRNLYSSGKKVQDIANLYNLSNTHTRAIIKSTWWTHHLPVTKLRDDRSIKTKESTAKSIAGNIRNNGKSASQCVSQIDIKTRNVINIFPSINIASKATGVPRRNIGYAFDNFINQYPLPMTGGFYWKREKVMI